MNYAADFRNLSLSQWEEDEEYGGDDYQFVEGTSILVDFLAQECKRSGVEIRTDAVVSSIGWSSDGVIVEASGQTYQAAQAVVTLPLGVLKNGTVEFRGNFPDSKRRAIERLGVGTLNKVVMVFPEQFWEDEAAYFGCLGDANEILIDYWNLEHVTGEPILAAIVGGEAAIRMESMSDADALRTVLQPLRRVFGSEVGEPVAFHRTRWASDPFTGGAYSHVRPGAAYSDYEVLAEPIEGRVFFAGEATSAYYPSTMHGAYESGERAARQILSAGEV
jgi:monoamine oxidase